MTGERERRLVFGEDAERYDRARPSYPPALVSDLVAWVGREARVADVGCGTAKAAMLLAEQGLSGIGVEPHPSMAAVARRNLGPFPGWRVDVADFETWDPGPDDVPVDLVTCAQAWHWVDPVAGWDRAAVLRPGGWLALWWNEAESEPAPIDAALDAIYAKHGTGLGFRHVRSDADDDLDAAPPGVGRDPPWTGGTPGCRPTRPPNCSTSWAHTRATACWRRTSSTPARRDRRGGRPAWRHVRAALPLPAAGLPAGLTRFDRQRPATGGPTDRADRRTGLTGGPAGRLTGRTGGPA